MSAVSDFRVLSVIPPPMTQLNTPYPSTAYLTGFLRSRGFDAVQEDLALALVLDLLSPEGLDRLREHATGAHFVEHFAQCRETIGPTIAFLQGSDPTLAHRIASRRWLPEGARFRSLDVYVADEDGGDPLAWAFGALGLQDRARHLATLYLNVRRRLLVAFGAAACVGRLAAQARPRVALLIAANAGSSESRLGSAWATPWASHLGRSVQVQHVSALSQSVSIAAGAAELAADGSSYVLQAPSDLLHLESAADPAAGFRPEDFRLVKLLGHWPLVLVASPRLHGASAGELLATMRRRAGSGTPLRFALTHASATRRVSIGRAIGNRLAALGGGLAFSECGGGAPLLRELLQGQADLAVMDAKWAGPFVEQGQLKAVASLTPAGVPGVAGSVAPPLPPALAALACPLATALYVGAKVPTTEAMALRGGAEAALAAGDVSSALRQLGFQPAGAGSMAAEAATLKSEAAQLRSLL
jgi:tripartite-type tricarboxylate transporter receptor subunit TctC